MKNKTFVLKAGLSMETVNNSKPYIFRVPDVNSAVEYANAFEKVSNLPFWKLYTHEGYLNDPTCAIANSKMAELAYSVEENENESEFFEDCFDL